MLSHDKKFFTMLEDHQFNFDYWYNKALNILNRGNLSYQDHQEVNKYIKYCEQECKLFTKQA
jgi:hypothetical protein